MSVDEHSSGWLSARWAEVVGLLQSHAHEGWAWEQLREGVVGGALGASPGSDSHARAPVGGLDEARGRVERARRGQVFTPPAIAALLAELVGVEERAGVALDPACGTGELLVAVCARRLANGWSASDCLAEVEGWELDAEAAWGARASLVVWALASLRPDEHPPHLRIFEVDALSQDGRPGQLLGRLSPFAQGVDAVVTNPPYLEAKRMGRATPGLRDALRARFPSLRGAWDLYVPFLVLAMQQVGPGGAVAALLPNKVLQSRYGITLRRDMLEGPVALTHVVDMSACKPRVFPGTGVYPVVLRLQRGAVGPVRMRRVATPDAIHGPWVEVQRESLRRVGSERPVFVPRSTWAALEPLFDAPRLGEVAEVRSTCSFHKKGLRELFVTPTRPDTHAMPYIGGLSRARRTEVGCFRLRWEGWWLRFDQDELRGVHGNALPDRAHFERPKVIFCQHGLRMRPVVDAQGRFATKDVYPIAWPTHPDLDVHGLCGVLSSTVFTALYNSVFHGVVCGSETFHYLPAFLKTVPVPSVEALVRFGVPELARALAGEGEVDGVAWLALDRAVAQAYGVNEDARQLMVQEHLTRVGAVAPEQAGGMLMPNGDTP